MKTKISTFIAVALMSSASFAQTETSTMPMPKSYMSSEGFRFGIVRPTLDVEYRSSGYGELHTSKGRFEESLGVSLGYAYLPIQELGWTANFVYAGGKAGIYDLGVARLEGNVTYAVNQYFNAKGGLNLSKVTGYEVFDRISPSLGLQVGVGAQITKNFGVDLNYLQLNQSGNIEGYNVSMKESGLELGVNGTF